jgi:hypothetical protein
MKTGGTRPTATKAFLLVIKRLGTQQENIIIIIIIIIITITIIIIYEKLCLTFDTAAIS